MRKLFGTLPGITMLLLGTAATAADKIGPLTPAEFVKKVDQLNNAYDRKVTDRKVELTAADAKYLFDRADKICNGVVYFYNREEIPVGQKDIDWTGKHKAHQEWVAQLNRFFMLETLIDAYRQNQDEKYAVRARELMEDWFNFWQKNDFKFIDPQKNSELNTSIRIRNWITALAVFRNSKAFDDAFVKRTIEMITKQTNMLAARTKEGDSNWQIAQAFALLEAGIALDFVPDSAAWREKGAQVLNGCFKRQFRADGSHVENTTGYHAWMTNTMVDAGAVGKLHPELKLAADPAVIEKALQFAQLSRPFAFNDSSYGSKTFPKVTPRPDFTQLAKRGGVENWKPLPYGYFDKAGLVFGGNGRELFFFDAAPYCAWHTHMSRLTFEFAADGYLLLIDPAISTYERRDPHYEYGRTTYSHATVNFNGAHQVRKNAEMLDVKLADNFGLAVGEFNGGSFLGLFADKYDKNLDADMQRAILWLDRNYLLVFDRTQLKNSPDGKSITNYVFPAAPMESWSLDKDNLRWFSKNAKKPNLLVQMLLKPVDKVELTCAEGVKEPKFRGWSGTARADMTPSPTAEFSADTGFNPVSAVTLLAAFPAGAQVPAAKVLSAKPGAIDFDLPGRGENQLRYQVDFRQAGELAAGKVKADATLLLVQGDKIFVYRAKKLTVDGKEVKLETPEFTGWIK